MWAGVAGWMGHWRENFFRLRRLPHQVAFLGRVDFFVLWPARLVFFGWRQHHTDEQLRLERCGMVVQHGSHCGTKMCGSMCREDKTMYSSAFWWLYCSGVLYVLLALAFMFLSLASKLKTEDEHADTVFRWCMGAVSVFLLFVGVLVLWTSPFYRYSNPQETRLPAHARPSATASPTLSLDGGDIGGWDIGEWDIGGRSASLQDKCNRQCLNLVSCCTRCFFTSYIVRCKQNIQTINNKIFVE